MNAVLNLLTKYLLQYRSVRIPSVGTIKLVQQPAQLNVVDKAILPPSLVAEIVPGEDKIPEHQLQYLTAALQEERTGVLQQLQQTGEHLSRRIKNGGFHWKGIGLLEADLRPVHLALPGFGAIAAERVLRPGAEHNVLVGDQQRTSTQMAALKEEVDEAAAKEFSIFIIVGWVLLILSVLYIIFVLYQGRFRMGSTGSRQAPTSSFYFLQQDGQRSGPAFSSYL